MPPPTCGAICLWTWPDTVRQGEHEERRAENDGQEGESRFHWAVLSFVDRTARPGAARYNPCVGCCFPDVGSKLNFRRLGTAEREVAIAEYRIICVARRADGHPRALGYTANGNDVMYDDLWTIEQAREAVEHGHRLYVVRPSSGEQVDLDLESYDELDELPTCG
jgi:hypothetical protein